MITERERSLLDPDALRLLEMHKKGQHASLLHEVDELAKKGAPLAGVVGIASLACTELERFDEGANAARKALEAEPQWAWLYHALAAAEAGLGRTDQALAAETRAVRLAPGEPAYGATLARYFRESGRPADALKAARQALLTEPDHGGALNELGLALLKSGDTAGALEPFRQAQAAHPDDPAGYINEGVLHLKANGARPEARRCFREALRRSPGLQEAEDRMADTLAAPGSAARAVLGHMLLLARITSLGWLIIAFLYYTTFRVLQIAWRLVPVLLPAAQALLWVTLAWLIGGLLVGHALRLGFRSGWPK